MFATTGATAIDDAELSAAAQAAWLPARSLDELGRPSMRRNRPSGRLTV
ncbi:hypothetical protein V6U90_31655 [Micromonospora sp. CPCC 206060]